MTHKLKTLHICKITQVSVNWLCINFGTVVPEVRADACFRSFALLKTADSHVSVHAHNWVGLIMKTAVISKTKLLQLQQH